MTSKTKSDSILRMVLTFFRRWWITRKLYIYIYRRKAVTALVAKGNEWPSFESTTRKQRVAVGIDQDTFIQWLRWKWEWWGEWEDKIKPDSWFSRIYFNLPWRVNEREYFEEEVKRTLKECATLHWIDIDTLGRLSIGEKGKEVYVWYYPFGAFIGFCERHKVAFTVIGGIIIGYAPLFKPTFLHLICLIFPLLQGCHA